jgi:hypothetical protein
MQTLIRLFIKKGKKQQHVPQSNVPDVPESDVGWVWVAH